VKSGPSPLTLFFFPLCAEVKLFSANHGSRTLTQNQRFKKVSERQLMRQCSAFPHLEHFRKWCRPEFYWYPTHSAEKRGMDGALKFPLKAKMLSSRIFLLITLHSELDRGTDFRRRRRIVCPAHHARRGRSSRPAHCFKNSTTVGPIRAAHRRGARWPQPGNTSS
jgi:hypothetical protein